MKKILLLLALICIMPACSGQSGDGEVISCACDIGFLDQGRTYPEGSIDLSLCASELTTDHASEAEGECVTLINATDTNPKATHECSCSCVHLADGCYMK